MSLIVLFYEDDLVSYPPLCPSVWSRADLSPLSALHAALLITGRLCRLLRRRCGGDTADLCSWRAWRRSAGRWDSSDSLKAVFFSIIILLFLFFFFLIPPPHSACYQCFPVQAHLIQMNCPLSGLQLSLVTSSSCDSGVLGRETSQVEDWKTLH